MKRAALIGLAIVLSLSVGVTAWAAPTGAPTCEVGLLYWNIDNPEIERSVTAPVKFDTWLYGGKEVGEECAWVPVDQGHWTLVIPGATVLAWETGNEGKLWITNYILEFGVAQAWLAREHLTELVGGVWPEGGVSQTFTVE